MSAGQRAGRTHHPLPNFPCGAFLKEKPRKIFFAGNVRSADGREQRANPGGFLSFLFGFFSFTERKRTKEKKKKRPHRRGRKGASEQGQQIEQRIDERHAAAPERFARLMPLGQQHAAAADGGGDLRIVVGIAHEQRLLRREAAAGDDLPRHLRLARAEVFALAEDV